MASLLHDLTTTKTWRIFHTMIYPKWCTIWIVPVTVSITKIAIFNVTPITPNQKRCRRRKWKLFSCLRWRSVLTNWLEKFFFPSDVLNCDAHGNFYEINQVRHHLVILPSVTIADRKYQIQNISCLQRILVDGVLSGTDEQTRSTLSFSTSGNEKILLDSLIRWFFVLVNKVNRDICWWWTYL